MTDFKISDCHWRRQVFRYDTVLGWWHLPNLSARLALGQTFHTVRTNAEGMRTDRNYPKERPQGRTRIVLLGDSYTAGDGVSNGRRFSDLLERRYPQLDVMNFGLNGSGTDQQSLIYETKASHYEHDAVIWGICVENIGRNLCTCRPSYDYKEHQVVYRPKPYYRLESGKLVLENQPVPLEKRPADALGDWVCYHPYLPEHPEDPYAIYRYPDRAHWQIMRRLLQRVSELAGRRPVLFMPLPLYTHYLEEAPASYLPTFGEVEDVARRRHVIDILPRFLAVRRTEREEFRFPGDPHYTVKAHELVADALEEALRQLLPGLLAPARQPAWT